MLPSQMQAIMVEQSKQILEKFSIIQKQSSLCYSGANSIDGDSSISNSNALQIPSIAASSVGASKLNTATAANALSTNSYTSVANNGN